MPRSARTAESASARGIFEDLKKVREIGGLDKARPADIESLITVLQIVEPGTESLHDAAKRRLRAAVVRTCWTKLQTQRDPCDRAAAHAVRRLLLRPADSTGKARTIRVDVLGHFGCALTPDGLRKREDVLLDEIGMAVWESLREQYEQSTSESPLAIAYEMLPAVASLRESIHELKRRLYPEQEPIPRYAEKAIPVIFHEVGSVRWLSFRLVNAVETQRDRTKVEDYLLMLARLLVDGPVLSGQADQDEFAKFYAANYQLGPLEFFDVLLQQERALADRCLNWLGECHETCAYMRTHTMGLLCRAHQFAALLQQFEDVMSDVESGDDLSFLESSLAAAPADG